MEAAAALNRRDSASAKTKVNKVKKKKEGKTRSAPRGEEDFDEEGVSAREKWYRGKTRRSPQDKAGLEPWKIEIISYKAFSTKKLNMSITLSGDVFLSSYEKLITGIEYRQKRVFLLGFNASLPSYFLLIRSLLLLLLSPIFSSYYPGPSFFNLPIYYKNIYF